MSTRASGGRRRATGRRRSRARSRPLRDRAPRRRSPRTPPHGARASGSRCCRSPPRRLRSPRSGGCPGIQAVETYSPGGVGLEPALVGVHRVERDRALLVLDLDLREHGLALAEDPEDHLDRDRDDGRRRRPGASPRAGRAGRRGSSRGRRPGRSPPATRGRSPSCASGAGSSRSPRPGGRLRRRSRCRSGSLGRRAARSREAGGTRR